MTSMPTPNNNEKPMCFGTYIGESDILCAECNESLKKECLKKTKKPYF